MFAQGSLLRAIRNGGSAMVPLLVVYAISVAGTAVLAIRAIRGRQLAPAWWVACIALPRLAASAVSAWRSHHLDWVLEGMVGDIVPRIVADGTAELEIPRVLGDLVSAACAVAIAIGLGAAMTRVDSRPAPKSVAIAGAAWAVASVVMLAAWVRPSELVGLPLVVPVVVVAMVCVAKTTSRTPDDRALIVALAAVVAVCLVERAIVERAESTAFEAVSGDSLDPVQRARILASFLPLRTHARVAIPVHVVLGALTFLLAYGRPRKHVLAAAALVVVVAGTSVFERYELARRLDVANHAFDIARDIRLPIARGAGWNVGGARFVVPLSGPVTHRVPPSDVEDEALVEELGPRGSAGSMASPEIPVFADARLGCGALLDSLHPLVRRRRPFSLAVETPPSEATTPNMGDLEALVGARELTGVAFDLNPHKAHVQAALVAGDAMTIELVGDSPMTFALSSDTADVGRAVAERLHGETLALRQSIELVVRREDSVQALASALTLLGAAFPIAHAHRYFALRGAWEPM